MNCLFGIEPSHSDWLLAIRIASMHWCATEGSLRIPEPSSQLIHGLHAAGLAVYRETLNVSAAKEMLDPGTYYEPPKKLTHYTVYMHPPKPVMQLPIHGPLVWRHTVTPS